jgi:hypothetical protein
MKRPARSAANKLRILAARLERTAEKRGRSAAGRYADVRTMVGQSHPPQSLIEGASSWMTGASRCFVE